MLSPSFGTEPGSNLQSRGLAVHQHETWRPALIGRSATWTSLPSSSPSFNRRDNS